jgi:hypothetical protein
MSHTLPQPRHARTEPPRQSDAIILQFPGSDPMADPDFSFLTAEDVAAILAIPWAAAITGLDRVAHRSRAILSPVPS